MTFTTWLSACFQKNQHLLQQLVVLSSLKNCLKLYIYIYKAILPSRGYPSHLILNQKSPVHLIVPKNTVYSQEITLLLIFFCNRGFDHKELPVYTGREPLEHLGLGWGKLRTACIHKGPELNYMHMREGTSYGSNSGRGN